MPRLIEYVKVGRCASYGDIDWSYNAQTIESLSRAELDALFLGMFHVQRVMFDQWLKAQPNMEAKASSSPSDTQQSI